MHLKRLSIGTGTLVLLGILGSGPLEGQQNGTGTARVARAATVSAGPVIDGRLDDAVWSQAEPLAGFVQREPVEGNPVSERTEVRILTDAEALYVGAWLYDRNPGAIVPGEKLRDVTLTNSDYFAFILDTYLDRQNGFLFGTTPVGVEHDGQVVREGEGGGVFQQGQSRAQAGAMGGFNLNWDGSWTVATSIDSLGWYAEFRIPFSTLRHGRGDVQSWGFNAVRAIRRRNEAAYWAPIPRQFNLMRLSRAGQIDGVRVPSRRTASFTPYVLSGARKDYVPTRQDTDLQGEAGLDAKIGLTPSLTLDLTVNTDFAQVEVDEVRTNLTRFPLFFPEKRPFFLENAGVFSAGTPQAVDLFFSRRIGIDGQGQPVPIIGGGRVTGKIGGLTVGALQIFTDDQTTLLPGAVSPVTSPANSYSVARVTRELPGRSRLGAIFVQRLAVDSSADHNRTYALDGRIGLGQAWTVDWWGARTETPGASGREVAFSGRIGWQTNAWNNSVRFVQVGEAFNPEVGFLPRRGYRFYDVNVARTVQIRGSSLFRYWLPHAVYRGYYDFAGNLQTEQYHVDLGEADFHNGGRIGPEVNVYGEGLIRPFQIADGVVIPVGTYRWTSGAFDFSTNPAAPLSLASRLEAGGFYNGSRYGGNASVTLRQRSLTTSLMVDYNDVNLPEGDFTRSLVGLRMGYFFTPKIFLQSLVQYGNQSRLFSANIRFAWLNTAGTGLFVVLNDAEEAEGVVNWTRPQTRNVVVKFTRQFGR